MSSFFSQITGFNLKALENFVEPQDNTDDDYSDVDFCVGTNDINLFEQNDNAPQKEAILNNINLEC